LALRGFLDFYRLRYPQICWHVHGSGLAGTYGVDAETFPALMALAFREIAIFATVAAEMILRYMGRWNATTKRLFADLEHDRVATSGSLFVTRPVHGGTKLAAVLSRMRAK
jgi:hypothetical protein